MKLSKPLARTLLVLVLLVGFFSYGHSSHACELDLQARNTERSKRLLKAYLFANLSFPQLHQGINISLAHWALSEDIQAKEIQADAQLVETVFKAMRNAHVAHNVKLMPSLSDASFVVSEFLSYTFGNIKAAARVLVPTDTPQDNQAYFDRLKTAPGNRLLHAKMIQYAAAAVETLQTDLKDDSKSYLQQIKKDPANSQSLARQFRIKIVQRVSKNLEDKFPELREIAMRSPNFVSDVPRSLAFYFTLALSGVWDENSLELFGVQFVP
jgi:hypothetical protein